MQSFRGSSLSLSVLYILITVYPLQCQLPDDCKSDRRKWMQLWQAVHKNKAGEKSSGNEYVSDVDEATCCARCKSLSDCIAYQFDIQVVAEHRCVIATDAVTAINTSRTSSFVSYFKSDQFKHYTVSLTTGEQKSTCHKHIQCTGENGRTRKSTWMDSPPGGGDDFDPYSLTSCTVSTKPYWITPQHQIGAWDLMKVDIQIEGHANTYSFHFDRTFNVTDSYAVNVTPTWHAPLGFIPPAPIAFPVWAIVLLIVLPLIIAVVALVGCMKMKKAYPASEKTAKAMDEEVPAGPPPADIGTADLFNKDNPATEVAHEKEEDKAALSQSETSQNQSQANIPNDFQSAIAHNA